MSKGRINPATLVVQRAQTAYPKALKSVVNYFGDVPYGQQRVDPRTADKQLLAMTPDDHAALAASDPSAAAAAQSRLGDLAAKPQSVIPGQDTYEP